MKITENKYNLLLFCGIIKGCVQLKLAVTITTGIEGNLLGVVLDRKLTFEQHVSSLCQKVRNKFHSLSRMQDTNSLASAWMLLNST